MVLTTDAFYPPIFFKLLENFLNFEGSVPSDVSRRIEQRRRSKLQTQCPTMKRPTPGYTNAADRARARKLRRGSGRAAPGGLAAVLQSGPTGPRYAVLYGTSDHERVEEYVMNEAKRFSIGNVRVESILHFDESVQVGCNVSQIVRRCIASDRRGCSSNLFTKWLCKADTIDARVIHIPLYSAYDDSEGVETRMNMLDLIQKFEKTPETRRSPPPAHAARVVFSCVGDWCDARTLRNQLRGRSWGKAEIPLCRIAPNRQSSSISKNAAVKNILSGSETLAEDTLDHLLANKFRFRERVLADMFSTLPHNVKPFSGDELGEMSMLSDLMKDITAADALQQALGAWRGGASSYEREIASYFVTHLPGLRIRSEDPDEMTQGAKDTIPASAVMGIEVRREALFRWCALHGRGSRERVVGDAKERPEYPADKRKQKKKMSLRESYARHKGVLEAKPSKEGVVDLPGSLPCEPPSEQYTSWTERLAPTEMKDVWGLGGKLADRMFEWIKKQTVDTSVEVYTQGLESGDGVKVRLVLHPSFPRGGDNAGEMSEDEGVSEDDDDVPGIRERVMVEVNGIASKGGVFHANLRTGELIPREARCYLGVEVLRAETNEVIGRVYPGSLPFAGHSTRLSGPAGSVKSDSRVRGKMSARTAKSDQQPHVFLVGPPGTGKSTIVKIMIRELFGPGWDRRKELTPVLKVINASNVSLGELREVMHDTMRRAEKERYNEFAFCIVWMDEMPTGPHSQLLQSMLRVWMEGGSNGVRFIITGNYEKCLIGALQSRVTTLRFPPITLECDSDDEEGESYDEEGECHRCINYVLEKNFQHTQIEAKKKGLPPPFLRPVVTKKAAAKLHRIARGDMRKLIQVLQCAYLSARRHGVFTIGAYHVLQWA